MARNVNEKWPWIHPTISVGTAVYHEIQQIREVLASRSLVSGNVISETRLKAALRHRSISHTHILL